MVVGSMTTRSASAPTSSQPFVRQARNRRPPARAGREASEGLRPRPRLDVTYPRLNRASPVVRRHVWGPTPQKLAPDGRGVVRVLTNRWVMAGLVAVAVVVLVLVIVYSGGGGGGGGGGNGGGSGY